MLDVHAIKARDLKTLSSVELTEMATQLLAHISEQSKHISEQSKHISEQSKHIGEQSKRIDSQAQAIKWRDAKIESITFQLARLKAWKFGAKTEAMNTEQRALFDETFAADQASLEAQLAALQPAPAEGSGAPDKQPRRQPKREALPPHLPRVDQRVEPEDTNCPTPECGQPMVRVGEDISERLDIVPAQFFVQRQIRGKWACRCCQLMVQEPAAPQVFDNALPTPGLQAHTVISRNARPPAVLPAGADQRPLWCAHAALDAGRLERADRRAVDAAVRGAPGLRARQPGGACRRDADRLARPQGPRRGLYEASGQDEEGLHVGLRARRLRGRTRGGV